MSARILIFAQTPPPVHGQSVMAAHLLEALRESGQLDLATEADSVAAAPDGIAYYHVNPQLSEDLGDVGKWSVRKLLRVFRSIFEAVSAGLRHRLEVFYFVPAPAKRAAMYRDWVVLLFCRLAFRRLVFHWHCIGQPEFVEQKLTVVERLLARVFYGHADLSICLSNYSREEASYFGSRHTVVVPNGIPDPCPRFDEEIWPERQKRAEILASVFSGGSSQPLLYEVLFLSGRLAPKGLFDAMAAVTRANRALDAQSIPLRLRLTVAGPFTDEAERLRYETAAAELNATRFPGQEESLAVAIGWVDESAKGPLYRGADCFIFPTTYPAESFGLVLAEAMAHGCAVVTTRWQAVPEVLPGGYPHIIDPHDIDAMAEALLLCARQSADRSLRDYFLARFTSPIFAGEMVRVLGNL
jgi:glycosyltransferase involved in cell wall biosynthesis